MRDVSSSRIIASTDIDTISVRACSTRPWYETLGRQLERQHVRRLAGLLLERGEQRLDGVLLEAEAALGLADEADERGALVVVEHDGGAVLGEPDDAGDAAGLVGVVGGELLRAGRVGRAEHEHLRNAPAAQQPLGGLARVEAEALALQLVGGPAARFGDDGAVLLGRGVRERELADVGEQAAEERLLGDRLVDGARERAGDHGVEDAAVPVDLEVEAGGDALLRHLAREREAERDDLERAHADDHRRAVQRGDLGAAVVEGRVGDAEHLAGEDRVARQHVGELADVALGVGAHAHGLERCGRQAGKAALEVESRKIDGSADVGPRFW